MAQESSPFRLGSLIRSARQRRGQSLQGLAERAGLSSSAVWEVEQGGGRMETVARLLTSLDVRIAGLPPGPTLGAKLRTLRMRRGWSVERCAERAGVSPNAVRRVEGESGRAGTVEAVMAVLAPKARERREERAQWQAGRRDLRLTPPEVLRALERVVGGPFDLDPCGHPASYVGARLNYMAEDDGLTRPWRGRVFVNPPHSGAARFIVRAHRAWSEGECTVVAMLIPAQVHLRVMHRLVFGVADVLIMEGRVSFLSPEGARLDRAPFGSVVVLFGADDGMRARLLAEFHGIVILSDVARARRSRLDQTGCSANLLATETSEPA